ncbi:class C sortase [Arcanobacterium hippocoleae]
MGAVITKESELSPREKRQTNSMLAPSIILIIGALVLLYPVSATLWNNYKYEQVAEKYSSLLKTADPQTLKEQLISARKYNAARNTGPILDPWLSRISQDNKEYQKYLAELDTFEIMARLRIPAINADLPIYHGTAPETLEKGAGHLFGSDLPVGGAGTHTILTAHTGLPNATLFDRLVDLKNGDVFTIDVSGETLSYKVNNIRIVLPAEAEGLAPAADTDLATLITCTPYGINSHRLLVTGERVQLTQNELAVVEESFGMPIWMIVFIAAAIFAILITILGIVRTKRPET